MSKNDEIEVKPFSDSFEFGDDWLNDLEEALDFDLPDFDVANPSGTTHASVASESEKPVSNSSSEALKSEPSSEESVSEASSETPLPMSDLSIESPASDFSVESPASDFSIESPASDFSLESPASDFSLESPASDFSLESPMSDLINAVPPDAVNTLFSNNEDSLSDIFSGGHEVSLSEPEEAHGGEDDLFINIEDFENTNESSAAPVVQEPEAVAQQEIPEISLDMDVVMAPETEAPQQELHAETASDAEMMSAPVTTKTLDVSSLQKKLSARNQREVSTEESYRMQESQFIALILMRLFDDFELLLLQKHHEEVVDLAKQFNRLANIISFCDMDEFLPMFAYITNLLPFTFSDAAIGQMSERQFDAMRVRRFRDHGVEILNCLMVLLRDLATKYPDFDTSRFADTLGRLYQLFGAVPGEPSCEAPLPLRDADNPIELTTRTFTKVGRTIEALVTESLHYIESSAKYGCLTGYVDATKSLNSAAQVANEYKFQDINDLLIQIYAIVERIPAPNPVRDVDLTPEAKARLVPANLFHLYNDLGELIWRHFGKILNEKKVVHFRDLLDKLASSYKKEETLPLCQRWKSFVDEAAPLLLAEDHDPSVMLSELGMLIVLAEKYEINWLVDTFNKLQTYWSIYPNSSLNAFSKLADDIMAFPTDDIEEDDLEQLNHRRLRVLFARNPKARRPQPYSVIHHAKEFTESFIEQFDDVRSIDLDAIEDILLDARNIKCHALILILEVILSIMDRIPADKSIEPDSDIVHDVYMCGGILESICDTLYEHVSRDPNAPVLQSKTVFYSSLMQVFQEQGRPRASITYFIRQRFWNLVSEFELVWQNRTSSPSTDYYLSLVRKLLHLSTLCEYQHLRQALVAHLDDIPTQVFLNTSDQLLLREYSKISELIRRTSFPEYTMPAGEKGMEFFSKLVSALGLVISLPVSQDPSLLRAELLRLEQRVSPLGMMTDFPPIIAILFEIHHLSYKDDVSREDVEELLTHVIMIANNVCPLWKRPNQAELEFIKAPISVPTQLFQKHLEDLRIVYEALKDRAAEDPVAWEHIQSVYHAMCDMTSYVPYGLGIVLQNAMNRCRCLKKNIRVMLDTSNYPAKDEDEFERTDDVITTAFIQVVELVVNLLIDHAFTATDETSQIRIVLQPVRNSCSASISHNARRLTTNDILDTLAKVNLDPAPYDNILEMLISSKRILMSYPAAQGLNYIQPILRQFNGRLDISDRNDGFTTFFVNFNV